MNELHEVCGLKIVVIFYDQSIFIPTDVNAHLNGIVSNSICCRKSLLKLLKACGGGIKKAVLNEDTSTRPLINRR